MKILEFECRTRGYSGMRFLDVGCGSGHRVLEIAKSYPNASFTAIDISGKSIEIARDQATKDGVKNIDFQHADLHHFQPDEKFHVVTAIGVLHHLPCPTSGLQAMRQHLHESGLMVGWLYHSFGEHDKTLRRQALRMLFEEGDSPETAMLLARELGGTVDPDRYGKSYGEHLSQNDHDSKDADAYLNPIVKTFTFDEALAVFHEAGFQWMAVDQINVQKSGHFLDLAQDSRGAMYTFNTSNILRGDLAKNRFYLAPPADRLRIVERLTLPTGFTIIAGSGPGWCDASKRISSNRMPVLVTPTAAQSVTDGSLLPQPSMDVPHSSEEEMKAEVNPYHAATKAVT